MQERLKSASKKIRDEIASILNKEEDFLNILVTVTDIQVSKDLQDVKIFISCLPEERMISVLKKLKKDTYDIIKILIKKIRFKNIPKVSFLKDEGYLNYLEVEKNILENENNSL